MLKTFLDELQAGKRDGSVVSAQTTGSLSADDKEAWRQLRKELESVGITPALFTQHRIFIVDTLCKAITEKDLAGDISLDQLNMPESAPQRSLTSNPNVEPASQSLQQLNQQRTNGEESTKIDAPRSKKVNALAKLLYRITNSRAALLEAAKIGDAIFVKQLLETGKVDVNSEDNKYGQTPLSRAAENGHEAVVKLLLKAGKADVNSKACDGQTPLSWAARNGHEAVVKLLLETGKADVDSKAYDGITPLLRAARNGHEAVVKLLLETGKVDVDLRDNYSDRTPLSWAAEQGHEAVVKLLLEMGKVDVNLKDMWHGRTPLLWAAMSGHEVVVKLLLETGKVNVDSKDKNDRTPLLWAARNGHKAVVKLLQRSIQ